MKVQDLNARYTGRARYARWAQGDVPQTSGCYAFTNVYDDVLYVGQSTNLYRRFEQHLDDTRMDGNPTTGLTHWFYYFEVPEMELKRTEDALLARHKFHTTHLPPLNRAGP